MANNFHHCACVFVAHDRPTTLCAYHAGLESERGRLESRADALAHALALAGDALADLFVSDATRRAGDGLPMLGAIGARALTALKEFRAVDTETPISLWAASFMKFGPPPWGAKGWPIKAEGLADGGEQGTAKP